MISEYFMCNIGVRQGDNLSQVLFALFINDFTQYVIKQKDCFSTVTHHISSQSE